MNCGKCFWAWSMIAACLVTGFGSPSAGAAELSLDTVQAVAREAYIYGYPLVDNYHLIYARAVNAQSAENQGGFNQVNDSRRAFIPVEDSQFSLLPLDLRAEPMVLTLPPGEPATDVTVQLVDLYTFAAAAAEKSKMGSGSGSFLLAGPDWKGEQPEGIKQVLRSETELAIAVYRKPLIGPEELENVESPQTRYQAEPLSEFLGVAPLPPPRSIEFLEPLGSGEEQTRLEFFNELAFLLQFCPPRPGDAAARDRFAEIGVLPGQPFGTAFLGSGVKSALAAGMSDGRKAIDARLSEAKPAKSLFSLWRRSQDEFAALAAGAPTGGNGNSSAETFDIPFSVDSGGHLLDGKTGQYTLTFAADQLPPTKGSWSLVMYSLPDQREVANPIDRFWISSPMLPWLERNADGGLTISIQAGVPGDGHDANWLPAPDGPFLLILRLNQPDQAVRDNAWEAPPVVRIE
jgi:hypothetical protein